MLLVSPSDGKWIRDRVGARWKVLEVSLSKNSRVIPPRLSTALLSIFLPEGSLSITLVQVEQAISLLTSQTTLATVIIDANETLSLFVRLANETNFHRFLLLSILLMECVIRESSAHLQLPLQVSDTNVGLGHIWSLINDFIVKYNWTADICADIDEKVVQFLHRVILTQQCIRDRSLRLTQLLPVYYFYQRCVHSGDPLESFRLMIHGHRDNVMLFPDDLEMAVENLLKHACTAFTGDHYDIVLQSFEETVSNAAQLKQLLAVGGLIGTTEVNEKVFRRCLTRLLDKILSHDSLEQLCYDLKSYFSNPEGGGLWTTYQKTIREILSNRVLEWHPSELTSWLHTEAYTEIQAPGVQLLTRYLCSSKEYEVHYQAENYPELLRLFVAVQRVHRAKSTLLQLSFAEFLAKFTDCVGPLTWVSVVKSPYGPLMQDCSIFDYLLSEVSFEKGDARAEKIQKVCTALRYWSSDLLASETGGKSWIFSLQN